MSKVIDWPQCVNKRILDTTSFTIGDGGYTEDKADSGAFAERALSTLFSPDTFEVQMDFSYMEKRDDNGRLIDELSDEWDSALSEYERFVKWYKYDHKRGVNPFIFPKISRFNVNDLDGNRPFCQYAITSALKPSKSGYCMRVSMTWKEVFSGIIQILDITAELDVINAQNKASRGILEAYYSASVSSSDCIATKCVLSYKAVSEETWTDLEITDVRKQGKVCYVYYDKITEAGEYIMRFSDNGGATFKQNGFTVA